VRHHRISPNAITNNPIADYNEAMRIDPKDHRNYDNRAIAHLTVQDHDHAIADLTTSLALIRMLPMP
jgi:hypothetical protein